jgi:hypothetical protein
LGPVIIFHLFPFGDQLLDLPLVGLAGAEGKHVLLGTVPVKLDLPEFPIPVEQPDEV